MHFADLAPCSYGGGPFTAKNWRVPLLSVGWIDEAAPYAKGAVDPLVTIKLKELLHGGIREFYYVADMGCHECTECQSTGSSGLQIEFSNFVLFVPGDRCVFATPGMIWHYISDHSYSPPKEFCDAVLACPLCNTPAYREKLCHENGGPIPFPVPVIGMDGKSVRWVLNDA